IGVEWSGTTIRPGLTTENSTSRVPEYPFRGSSFRNEPSACIPRWSGSWNIGRCAFAVSVKARRLPSGLRNLRVLNDRTLAACFLHQSGIFYQLTEFFQGKKYACLNCRNRAPGNRGNFFIAQLLVDPHFEDGLLFRRQLLDEPAEVFTLFAVLE